MPDFAYTARTLKGDRVTGKLSAANEREAVTTLSGQSLFPLEVKIEKPSIGFQFGGRVKGRVMAVLYTQLASLLRAGVPLLKSLRVLRDQSSNKRLQETLDEVCLRVEDGETLAEAMSRHPKAFNEMAVNMVRAGGEGGFLEDALERVAQFTEQQEELKARTMGALAYPMVLATIGSIIVGVLITFFVPMFSVMFERLKERGELPLLTEMLLGASDAIRTYGIFVAPFIVVGLAYLYIQSQTPKGRRIGDALKLRIPLAGGIFQSLAVARFCRVLGTMLKNGVPILKSLEISRQAAGNVVLAEAIEEASENISSGASLAAPLSACGHFPRNVVEMIAVAEESNTLDNVLVEIADGLERHTARRLDLLVRMIEPMMLLIMAGIVLAVVIALLMPIIKMSSAI
ncbi:MAG: type II secretion system F family protein [Pirellulaceae bacterium]